MARSITLRYTDHSLAESTRRAYAADVQHFQRWGGRMPATPNQVSSYLTAHALTHKSSTLVRRVAAISHEHSRRGLPNPTSSQVVKSTLRGIRRVHGAAAKQAHAFTPNDIKALIKPIADYNDARNLRDAALILLGFSGGFRRSELAALQTDDITFATQGVVIHLRRSKTDTASKGRDVALPFARSRHCAAKALRAWLKRCEMEEIQSHAVFRRIDRHGHLGWRPLSPAAVGWILLQRMRQIGMDTNGYSAHSLRAGFVTSAARAGTPTWAIQRQTGHRSEQMVHRYIRGLDPFELNASQTLFTSSRMPSSRVQRGHEIQKPKRK